MLPSKAVKACADNTIPRRLRRRKKYVMLLAAADFNDVRLIKNRARHSSGVIRLIRSRDSEQSDRLKIGLHLEDLLYSF